MDWEVLFRSLAEHYGWTHEQILKLPICSLEAYARPLELVGKYRTVTSTADAEGFKEQVKNRPKLLANYLRKRMIG